MTTAIDETMPCEPTSRGAARHRAAGLPRLLAQAPEDLQAHLSRYGTAPYLRAVGALIGDVEASGLTGRGGAAFPVHRKLAAVAWARSARKVAVANGAESEPASRKDELLLRIAPHLVSSPGL